MEKIVIYYLIIAFICGVTIGNALPHPLYTPPPVKNITHNVTMNGTSSWYIVNSTPYNLSADIERMGMVNKSVI